jgi:membrane fusion protein (multidrug efflux system)
MAILTRPSPGRFIAIVATMSMLGACDNGAGDSEVAPPLLEVLVIEAEQRDVSLSMDMVGTTRGTQDVPIRARVEGFVESMAFDEGTFVEKGDLLYTIDAQPFQAKLVEAQSQLAAARTNLTKARSDLSRIRPLAAMNAVSKQDLDSAVAQEAAARASVNASAAAVKLAEIELGYTRMSAPIDGLIGLSKAKPGEFVGRDPNPVVLNVLSDIDPIRVRFSITEREYLLLARNAVKNSGAKQKGSRVGESERPANLSLFLADNSEHPHKGRIVATAQSIDQETGTFTLEAAFPNPERILLPGQFARVRAPYQGMDSAVVIPRRALAELQGRFRVYVVVDGRVTVRDVALGPEAGDDVVIESGLQSGETVIVEGLQKVRPDMAVTTAPYQPIAGG